MKILLEAPSSAIKSINMRWLESTLEKNGHYQLVQLVCWRLFWVMDKTCKHQVRKWSQQVIKADSETRWIIQRDAYVLQEIRALEGLGGADLRTTKPQLNAYKTELQRLNDCYWSKRKLTWNLKGKIYLTLFPGPSMHSEATKLGIFLHGSAMAVLDVVGAVVETVAAVIKLGHIVKNH